MAATIGTGELLKDRYRLGRTLGRGGMAAVWLGHDEVLDRPVAVKVLADTIAADPGFVARFRREAQTAAGLTHPNLVGVYDFSEENERPYLVMQFVPGENLAARLERGERVDCDQLAREMLEALTHIHGAGILHRDVKPANIIIQPDGTAKLIDFGIAQPRDATAMTKTGLILATERYAAPEVMEGKPASERSDLYSLGVVLRSCEGGGSPALGSLVERLTEKDPERRPASAREALARLEREEPGLGQPTQVYEPTPPPARRTQPASQGTQPPVRPTQPASRGTQPDPPPPPAPQRRRARPARTGAVVALLAVAAAIAAVAALVLGGGGEDDPGSGGQPRVQEAKSKPEPRPKKEEQGSEAAAPSGETAAPAAVAEGADPERGASLNEEGFSLIQAGEYEAAVPVLEEAVSSFPAGTEDLSYAYALFNLGNALRLSGRPEEAIPVLEKRLEIPNQTATVEEELEAARTEAG